MSVVWNFKHWQIKEIVKVNDSHVEKRVYSKEEINKEKGL